MNWAASEGGSTVILGTIPPFG